MSYKQLNSAIEREFFVQGSPSQGLSPYWVKAFTKGWQAATLAERERIKCWCETCRPITLGVDMRMVLCPTCGNKRCPRATDHRNACTGSNEPGQPGSSYGPAIRKGETP